MEGLEAIRKEAAQLVPLLGDRQFKKREQATKALYDMGLEIVPVLQKALGEATDAEVKVRLEKLLKALDAAEYLKDVAPPQPPAAKSGD